jgi:hypothetical protein
MSMSEATHQFCSDEQTYRTTLREAADFFGETEEFWDDKFRFFLQRGFHKVRDEMDPYHRAVCYSIYRIDKQRWAFNMARERAERWKMAAIELGHSGIFPTS